VRVFQTGKGVGEAVKSVADATEAVVGGGLDTAKGAEGALDAVQNTARA